MFKGICITGLDGNFATKVSLQQHSKQTCLMEFDDEQECQQFLARNRTKLYSMSIACTDDQPLIFEKRDEYSDLREFSFGKSQSVDMEEHAD
jgi:hypothetical protein